MQSARHRVRRGAPALPPLALAEEREREHCEPGALEGEGGARRAEGEAEGEAAGRERVEPGLSRWALRLPGLPDVLPSEDRPLRLLPIQHGRLLRRLRHLLYATVSCAKSSFLTEHTRIIHTRLPSLVVTILDKIRKNLYSVLNNIGLNLQYGKINN